MKTNKRMTRLGAMMKLSAFALLLASCGQPAAEDKKEATREPIKVGVILPLTGPAAVYGEHAKAGQVKALDDMRARYGNSIKLDLRVEDGKGDPKASISAYYKLRDEGVRIFVTTISSVSMALKPLAEKDSVLFFGDAAHPDITKGGNLLTFRHSNTATQEAQILADEIASKGYASTAVLYITDEYGIATAEALRTMLEAKNVAVRSFEGYDKTQNDFSVLVQKVKGSKPASIVVVGFGNAMGLLVKRLGEVGIKAPTLASIGYIITGADAIAGNMLPPLSYVTFDFPAASDSASAPGPRSFEVLEFGTISLLGDAVKQVGGEPVAIGHHLRSTKNFKTAYETMSVSEAGDITPGLRLERVAR